MRATSRAAPSGVGGVAVGAEELLLDEAPVERDVVGHEHPAVQPRPDLVRHVLEVGSHCNHFLGDPRESHHS